MEESQSIAVSQEAYEEMLHAAVALVKKIQEKQGIETETITKEEADFANAFMAYANDITTNIENSEQV